MSGQPSKPTPRIVLEALQAFQLTAALTAAIEFDLFSAIAEGSVTVQALSGRLAAAERGVRILCDFLVIHGLLTKKGDQYGLTPESKAFLDRKSPTYIGGVTRFLAHPERLRSYENVTEAVRRGGTAMKGGGSIAPENPLWVEFARGMAAISRPNADFIAGLVGASGGPIKVLDIAAGHGLYGITLARKDPAAEIYALDWPQVLEVALANARQAGVAERYHLIPGSAFEVDLESGYDLVLLTNFLHHFDEATCTNFLRRVHGALREEGRAVTLEFVPNEDRVSPKEAAAFSFTMLNGTPAGDAYTFRQLDCMLRQAGFSRSEIHAVPGSPQQVILSFR